ncbi:MAG: HAD-IIA family hydrolase [Candidatus Promineifilaceae bacterium]
MVTDDLSFQNLIIDMDGVLWRGETPVPGLPDFFAVLRAQGLAFVLATNNATKTAAQYERRLAGYGVEIPARQILNSAEASALFLRHKLIPGAAVYVVGEEGLRMAMEEQGLKVLAADGFIGPESRADAVVVGFTRYVCYPQLASAAHLINHGADFIGTNPDVTIPTEMGPLPGAGSLLAFIKAATGVEPVIVGKPNRTLFDEALRRLNSQPQATAMVGDRLTTDIAGGSAAGLKTILLLSGVTDQAELEDSSIQPDLVFEDLRALTTYLKRRNS